MAIKYGVAINVCDDCGHRWLPEVKKSVRCPNRACRSRHWNDSEKVIDDEEDVAPSRPAAPETPANLFARLGLTTASKMHEQPQRAPDPSPVEHDEPAAPMCPYTEYDPESGETYRCGLRQHTFKVKHTRGDRV
jgi:hypothetical protein